MIKSISYIFALVGVASAMLTGCNAESEIASDTEISGFKEMDSIVAASVESSDASTEGVSVKTSSADEAASALSVPDFNSVDEEQWVLDQISGVWETNSKPACLYVFDGKEVTHYTPDLEGVDWPDTYIKEKEKSQIVSFEKKTEDDDEYYRIELSGFSWAVFYWRPNMPYELTSMEPYSASNSFERPYGYSYENKITIEDYERDFNIVE